MFVYQVSTSSELIIMFKFYASIIIYCLRVFVVVYKHIRLGEHTHSVIHYGSREGQRFALCASRFASHFWALSFRSSRFVELSFRVSFRASHFVELSFY